MKPIAFYPHLAKELGNDIEAAIYYQQLYYWNPKGGRKDGFIYKTKAEIYEETVLTREKQDRIRKKLVKLGWIEVKKIKANGAPTLHYRCKVGVDIVVDKQNSISVKPTNGKASNTPILDKCETHVSLTESTREKTSETIKLKSFVGINSGLTPISKIL